MARSELRKEWEQRIKEYKSSGQSASKWCAAHDISIHQFWYWQKKLKSSDTTVTTTSSKWMALEMCDSHEDSRNALLVKVGPASVEVKPGFDPVLLTDVVRTLKSIC
jgi:hypothetical protein